MAEFVISTCSTFDLTKEHADSRDISVIYFHYSKNGERLDDDMFQSVTPAEFYGSMVAGADMKTSQINTGEFLEYFGKFLKDGKDVIHFSLSSGISGVYSAAETAAKQLRTEFPDRKLYVIDSLAASGGLGLLVDQAADLRDEGKTIDEVRDWVEQNKLRLHHWFFSTDLTFYIKGGRVSKVSGAIGGMLGICPLLNVSVDGKLVPRAKVRPKKKVIIEMVKRMEEHAENGYDYSGKVYMTQSECLPDAQAVADLITSKFPKMQGKVEITSIGAVIGIHTGPGTVALFFWGDPRVD
ncbi:MAG: DegV family protein [Clostridia bacterium]|nr:DegV family protein [Clostridia bacterium]